MNKKKFFASLIALTVMTSMFGGCAAKTETPAETTKTETAKEESKAEEPEKAAEPVTIKVSFWTDEKEEMAAMKQIFEEKNPNIKLELLEFPSEEYKDKLIIQLAGGSDIDVITHKNTAEFADVANKDQLLDIEPLIQRDAIDIAPYGPLYEGLKMDGVLYGIPYRKTAWGLYYNKDLFDAAGVEYPTDDMTWEQFRELAKKMDKDKIAGAYLHTWPQTWYGMGLQTGASIIDEDLTVFKDALQFRMDLEKDGSIMTYIDAKATNAHYKTEFAKGQTAMNVIGDFHVGQLRELEKSGEVAFDWDVAAMPHPEGVAANTTWGTTNPISINVKSKNQEAAWEFVKFVSGPEGAKIYAEMGSLPAYTNDEIQTAFAGDASLKPANIKIFTEAKVYLENPTIAGAGIVKDEIYGRESELTFAGERSVEDTFKVIQERVKAEIQ